MDSSKLTFNSLKAGSAPFGNGKKVGLVYNTWQEEPTGSDDEAEDLSKQQAVLKEASTAPEPPRKRGLSPVAMVCLACCCCCLLIAVPASVAAWDASNDPQRSEFPPPQMPPPPPSPPESLHRHLRQRRHHQCPLHRPMRHRLRLPNHQLRLPSPRLHRHLPVALLRLHQTPPVQR